MKPLGLPRPECGVQGMVLKSDRQRERERERERGGGGGSG
jgi:hypothetical protein